MRFTIYLINELKFRTVLVYIYTGRRDTVSICGEEERGLCCTYMCDPGTKFGVDNHDCAFRHCYEKFEKLIEFSQMSMIEGFKDYLFKQCCVDDNYKFSHADLIVSHF